MTVEQALRSLLGQRILLLDGAMGTMIQQERLDEGDFRGDRWAGHDRDLKGNNELLCVTRPDLIRGIHERYLAAGVDIIATNTFGATSIAQEDYGLPEIARELNLAAARIAREACDRFATPPAAAFCCRRDRANAAHGEHFARCCRPGGAQRDVRCAAPSL